MDEPQLIYDVVEIFENERYSTSTGTFSKKELPRNIAGWSSRTGINRVAWYELSNDGNGAGAAQTATPGENINTINVYSPRGLDSPPSLTPKSETRRNSLTARSSPYETPPRKRSASAHSFQNEAHAEINTPPKVQAGGTRYPWQWKDEWKVDNLPSMLATSGSGSSADGGEGGGWLYGFDFVDFARSLARGEPLSQDHRLVRTRRWVRTRMRAPSDEKKNDRVLCEGYLGKMARLGQRLGRSSWKVGYFKLWVLNEGLESQTCVVRSYDSKEFQKQKRSFKIHSDSKAEKSTGGRPLSWASPKHAAPGDEGNPQGRFCVVPKPGDRRYIFAADGSNDRDRWIKAISASASLCDAPAASSQSAAQVKLPSKQLPAQLLKDAKLLVPHAVMPGTSAPSLEECTIESMTLSLEERIDCSAKEFFAYFVSEEAIFPMREQHERRKQDEDVKCMPWSNSGLAASSAMKAEMDKLIENTESKYMNVPGTRPGEDNVSSAPTRIMTMKTKTPVGSRTKVSKLQWYFWLGSSPDTHTLVLHTSSTSWDVPYASYFTVEDRFVVRSVPEDPSKCILRVYLEVHFSRSTIIRSMINKNARKAATAAYREWYEMAAEALAQERAHQKTETPVEKGSVPEAAEQQEDEDVAAPPQLQQLTKSSAVAAQGYNIHDLFMAITLLLHVLIVWILLGIRRALVSTNGCPEGGFHL